MNDGLQNGQNGQDPAAAADGVPQGGVPATQMPDDSDGFRLAERAAHHLFDLKGEDIVILDLRGLSDFCDFFVLATGRADVQVKALARAVRDGLLQVKQKPVGSEGEAEGRWVLLDFVDVIVHVFRSEVRQYYQLERLWGDAGVLPVDRRHLDSEACRRRHPDLEPPGPATDTASTE